MSTDRPRFSIVVPTRNRAHLLRHAVQSALAQTYDDFEIVISNNDSSDNTDEVARSFADPRVRYVQTDRTLPMSIHWEFALEHAQGLYVTFLCDDDGIVPSLLSRIDDLLQPGSRQVVYWTSATYYHQNWTDVSQQNRLMIPPHDRENREEEPRSLLRDLFDLKQYTRSFPKMLNSCCSREHVEMIRKASGRFFQVSCPDYSSAATLLSTAESCHCMPLPLGLCGASAESIGASVLRRLNDKAISQFWKEYEGAFEWLTPLTQGSAVNAIADTLVRTRSALSAQLGEYDLDWSMYFCLCWDELATERRCGGDVAQLFTDFHEALKQQPENVQNRVWTTIAAKRHDWWKKFPVRMKVAAVRVLPSVVLDRISSWRNISGRSAGFTDIAEAAGYLESQLTHDIGASCQCLSAVGPMTEWRGTTGVSTRQSPIAATHE